jgi:hypothetical protein
MAMAGERETGASNVEYNLVSVLYHTLHGAENLTKYEQDAVQAGDHETAQLFREMREADRERGQRLRMLLGKRISKG